MVKYMSLHSVTLAKLTKCYIKIKAPITHRTAEGEAAATTGVESACCKSIWSTSWTGTWKKSFQIRGLFTQLTQLAYYKSPA